MSGSVTVLTPKSFFRKQNHKEEYSMKVYQNMEEEDISVDVKLEYKKLGSYTTTVKNKKQERVW